MLRSEKLAVVAAIVVLSVQARAEDLPLFLRLSPPPDGGCSAGAQVLPGTKTCMQLNGAVLAELSIARPRLSWARPSTVPAPKPQDLGGPFLISRGYLSVDTRTPTDLGIVRTFLSVRGGRGL